MRTQQQAERAEQQRIKNLVLNYDLTDEQDGEEPSFHYVQSSTNKRVHLVGKGQLNASLKPRGQGRSGHFQQSTTTKPPFTGKDDKRRTSYDSGYGSPPAQPIATGTVGNTTITHADGTEGALENPHSQPRLDKSGNTRSKQRARKLQLGDLDWYGRNNNPRSAAQPPATTISLDSYVVDKRPRHNSGAAVDRTRLERNGSEAMQQDNVKKSG